jgi:hypothetical protein
VDGLFVSPDLDEGPGQQSPIEPVRVPRWELVLRWLEDGQSGFGVGDGDAVGCGVGVAVGAGVGSGSGGRGGGGVGLGVAVGFGVGDGLAVGAGVGVGVAVGAGVGAGVAVGAGVGGGVDLPGVGVGEGAGDGVAFGVAVGVGLGVGQPMTVTVTVSVLPFLSRTMIVVDPAASGVTVNHAFFSPPWVGYTWLRSTSGETRTIFAFVTVAVAPSKFSTASNVPVSWAHRFRVRSFGSA